MSHIVEKIKFVIDREIELSAEVSSLFRIERWNPIAKKTLIVNYGVALFFAMIALFIFYQTNRLWAFPIVLIILVFEMYNYLRKHFVVATFGHPLSVESLGEVTDAFPRVWKVHLFSKRMSSGSTGSQRFAYNEYYGSKTTFPKRNTQVVMKHKLHDYFVVPATSEFINGFCLDDDRKKLLLAEYCR